MSSNLESLGQKLLELITRRGADGRPVYPPRASKDLFCLLLLSSRIPSEGLSMECRRLLGEFALKVGFTGRPGTTLAQKVKAYFIRSPIDPALRRDFQDWIIKELRLPPPGSMLRSTISG